MATLNYAEQYSRALANAFPYSLYFGALYATPTNGRYKFIDAKTIKIPTITTTGRVDADRDTIATATRNYDNSWETKTLTHERKWSTLVHPMDIDQTNMVASIANITRTFNEFQKFPEMDAFTISKIFADWTALGTMAETPLETGAYPIYSTFRKMMLAMDNKRVPLAGRILYLTHEQKNALEAELFAMRRLSATEGSVNGGIDNVDGVKIVGVPAELMKTAYVFTTGWKADSSAVQINMCLIHPLVVITPVSYAFSQLEAPSALSEGKFVYYEESFEDVFILNKQADGIQFNTAAS